MSEEKSKINKKNSIIMIIVAFVLVVILTIVLLLELGRFDKKDVEMSVDDFIISTKNSIVYEEDGISMPLGQQVQAYLVRDVLLNNAKYGYRLEDTVYSDGRVYINTRWLGLSLPVTYKAYFEKEGDKFFLNLEDLRVSKNLNDLPDFLDNLIENATGLKENKIFFDANSYLPSAYYIEELAYDKETLNLKIRVNEDIVSTFLNSLKPNLALAAYYKDSKDTLLNDAFEIKENKIEYNISEIINIGFVQPALIYDLLAFNDIRSEDALENYLSLYSFKLSEENLNKSRDSLLANYIDVAVKKIYAAFESNFKDRNISINQGKPYDLDNFKIYTLADLIKEQELENNYVYDDMCFIYDKEFKVAYKIDEDRYYLRGSKSRDFITKATFEKMAGSKAIEKVEKVKDKKDWDEIVAFFTEYFEEESLFVRYLRRVGDDYLIILSPKSDFQDYFIVAFSKKSGKIDIIDDNIKAITKFIIEHKDYPAQIFLKEIADAKLVRISEDTKYAIMDELKMRGIIKAGDDKEITFSSYDGIRYIYFMLSDGREFVFKVEQTRFGTYLATVYNKEKAFRNWDDINLLITLEESPQSDN